MTFLLERVLRLSEWSQISRNKDVIEHTEITPFRWREFSWKSSLIWGTGCFYVLRSRLSYTCITLSRLLLLHATRGALATILPQTTKKITKKEQFIQKVYLNDLSSNIKLSWSDRPCQVSHLHRTYINLIPVSTNFWEVLHNMLC